MASQLVLAVATLVVYSARCSEGGDKFDMSAKAGNWTADHVAAGSEEVELSFWVKQTHLNKLNNVLDSVSDPKSPNYGHYLTKQEVDNLTAPTEHDVAVVESALRPHKIQHKGGSSIILSTVPVSFATQLFGGSFVYFCRGEGEQRSCVLRNPNAVVPTALHAACDIITPLDDPLPPIFHGPIVSPPSVISEAAAAEDGCCFSYGFGAMMKPCCLEAHMVAEEAACHTEERIGGATKFKKGACPDSAEEAAAAGVAQAQELPAMQGCCVSFGYGALMKPCCLSVEMVADKGACAEARRMGGRTFYHSGTCPVNVDEASRWAPKSQLTQQAASPNASRTTENKQGSPLMFTISSAFVAALFIGSVVMWLRGRQEARNAPLLDSVPE